MQPRLLATRVTTTSYGSWLPGDPMRLAQSRNRMGERKPILFSIKQQTALFDALRRACDEFGYRLTDASIESWHLHWIVGRSL